MIVNTYRSVLDDYRTHPEAKSLGPNGQPCDRATVGLLSRRPVKAATIHYIGKESNKIEEGLSGLVTDLDEVLTEYHDHEQYSFPRLVAPVLRELPVDQVAAGAGTSERTVKRARAGQSISKATRAKLSAYAIRHARVQVRVAGVRPSTDAEALLAAYLDRQPGLADAGELELLCACGCGRAVKRGLRGPPSK